jgi:uncharacterized membrane protein
MNCPKCASPVNKSGRFCASCGHDFGTEFLARFTVYLALKNEADRIGAVQNDLASGLANLTLRLREFENLLAHDLARSSPMGPGAAQPGTATVRTAAPAASPIPAAAPSHGKAVTAAPVSQSSRPVVTASGAPSKRGPSEMEVQVGQKWLLVIGILTMVFGVGYFLKYSFDQGWVGPEGRVAMAYLWGIAFLVAGDRFRLKFESFGLFLIGGGIAVLYFSAFAAFQLYHLFTQTASFSIMVLITALACALAIRYDAKGIAVLGLIGGFLTPLLLTTGQDNQIALMTYMTILNLGLLGIAFSRKWDVLNTLGFLFTYLLYAAWHARHYHDSKFWPAILFLNVFFLIYALVPFAYQVRKGGHSEGRELALMGINSLLAFGYGYAMIRGLYGITWVSVITVFYACVFLSLATYLYRQGKQGLDAFVVMLAHAMLFLVITVPVLFSKHWITVFWSAQGFATIWMAGRLERRSLAGGGYALLVASAVKFLLYDYPALFHMVLSERGFSVQGGYAFLMIERCLTSAVLVFVLVAAGAVVRRASPGAQVHERGDDLLLSLLSGAVLFIVLTAETSSFFHDYLPQARFAAISVLWTLFSVALMLLGFRRNNAALRKTSFGLFLVTVLKVFLFDMANVSTPYRIISFIILGLVLVGTSYLYYRHKDRIITALTDRESGSRP